MNNEKYNQIIDEVYKNYAWKTSMDVDGQFTKKEFINKCKTDTEFSEKWRLKIEERCLSWEERDFPILRHSTKLITVTYQENKIEIYD